MNLKIERFAPFGMGILVALLCWQVRPVVLPGGMKDLLSAVVNISAILVGFLSTVWSILVSIQNQKVILLLKDAGYYQLLFDYLSEAISWLLGLTVLSALGLLMDFTKSLTPLLQFGFVSWVFLLTASIVACFRVLRIFAKVLRFDKRG